MLKTEQLLRIMDFKKRLPFLPKTDQAYVLGHMVVLETAGIPADGNGEKSKLERLLLQFAWRMAYCRHVERMIKTGGVVVAYDAWIKSLGKS